MSYAYIFEGRKPSTKRVLDAIRKAEHNGEDLIEIYWGENSITLELSNGLWYGWGWIKEISGQGIAEGKNAYKKYSENQTLNLWNS
jgi:hypothetical protein